MLKWLILFIFSFIFLLPALQLVRAAFIVEPAVWAHISENLLLKSIFYTFSFSIGCSFIAALFGVLFFYLRLSLSQYAFLFKLVMLCALCIPIYVYGFVYLSFLDFSGPVQEFVQFEPRTLFVAILIYGLAASPYVYFSMEVGLQSISKNIFESSRILNKSLWFRFQKIILPSLKSWVLGGSTLVFLEAASDLGFVDFFSIDTLSRLLYRSWGGLFSFGGAARIGIILFGFVLIFIYLFKTLEKNKIYINTKAYQNIIFCDLSLNKKVHHILLFSFLVVVLIGVPIFQLLSLSFGHWDLPWGKSLLITLLIGFIGTCFVGLSSSCLFFLWRKDKSFSHIQNLLFVGYGLPGTLLAVSAFLTVMNFESSSALFRSSLLMLIILCFIYTIKFSSLMLRGLLSEQNQIPQNILDSARLLKKNIFWKVEFPFYRSALGLGFFLLFIEIVKELPAALMLKPFFTPSLALRVYQFASESDWNQASVYAVSLVGLCLGVQITASLFSNFFVNNSLKKK